MKKDLAKSRASIFQRAFVTGAVLSSAAFLEAEINKLSQDVVDGGDSCVCPLDEDPRKLIKAFWDLTEERNRSLFSILDKYQIVLISADASSFQQEFSRTRT